MRRISLVVVFLVVVDLHATVITFGDMPTDGSGTNRQVGLTYASLGVAFNPPTQGVCGGIGNGNPGAWGVEGTNSSQFLCMNTNPGKTVEIIFEYPQNAVSFAVTRAISGTGGSVVVSAYAGATLLQSQVVPLGAVNAWQNVSIIDHGVTRVTCDSATAWGLDNIYLSRAPQNLQFQFGALSSWQLSGAGTIANSADIGAGFAAATVSTIATGTDAQQAFAAQCVPAGVATYHVAFHVSFPSGQLRTGGAGVLLRYFANPDCTMPISSHVFPHVLSPATEVNKWFKDGGRAPSPAGTQSMQLALWVLRDAGTPEASVSARFDNVTLSAPLFDVDHDGQDDLLWRNYGTGVNAAWKLSALSSPQTFTTAVFPPVSDPAWRLVGVADMNADEQPDFIWRNSTTGANAIWLMNGTSVVNVVPLPPAAITWQIATVADMNHDRLPDIVWRDYSTGNNAIWFMNGTAFGFAKALPPVPDINWRIAAAGDMNEDDQNDLIWRHYGSGANAVWYVQDGNVTGVGSMEGVADLNWQIAGVTHLSDSSSSTGTNSSDLLWRNYSTGANAVWFMNGAATFYTISLPSAPDVNWQLAGPK